MPIHVDALVRNNMLPLFNAQQILLNIEHRLMSQAAAPCEYDSLSIMQKVEVFEMSLKHTAGQDLYKVCFGGLFSSRGFTGRSGKQTE